MIRIRGPSGATFSLTLSDIESGSVRDLTAMLKTRSEIQEEIEVLSGFPPSVICSSMPADERPASELQIKKGDTLIIRALPHPAPALSPTSHQENKRIKVSDLSPPMNASQSSEPAVHADEEEDTELALALAASLSESVARGAAPSSQPPLAGSAEAGAPKAAPTAIKMSDGSVLVRRIVDSDNSCLFNSVGYLLMNHDKSKSKEMRGIVSNAIRSEVGNTRWAVA